MDQEVLLPPLTQTQVSRTAARRWWRVHSHDPVHSQHEGQVAGGQADGLQDDGDGDDASGRDARRAHARGCGRHPGNGAETVSATEGSCVREMRSGTHRMVKICPPFSSALLSCAMKTAAMHWKMAAPSMLTVAPMGRMKRLMRLSTPLFSSTHLIMEGSVAELRGTQQLHLRVAFGRSSQMSTE